MQKNLNDIVIFFIIVSGVIVLLGGFVISLVILYRKRQKHFVEEMEQVKLAHANNLLQTKLEIQEQTFQHISREIHDNISLSLTLARLQLHIFDIKNEKLADEKLQLAGTLITKSITELNDISKSLDGNMIARQGLLAALEAEMELLQKTTCLKINFEVTGNPLFLESSSELVIFRIIQECFNNIIRHAGASHGSLLLHYDEKNLKIKITDNGKGFDIKKATTVSRSGLKNMEDRTRLLDGQMNIESRFENGSVFIFTIPMENKWKKEKQ